MSATININIYSEPEYNPLDVWHKREGFSTYIYPDDMDKFTDILDDMGGASTEGPDETLYDFPDADPHKLADNLTKAGMADTLPTLPDGKWTGFSVDILY